MVRHRSRTAVLAISLVAVGLSCTGPDDDAGGPVVTARPATSPAPVVPPTTAPPRTGPGTTATATSTTTITTTTGPATTTATDLPGAGITDDHRRELEAAGLGWMLDVDYPVQPAGVPWPTAGWPTGPLPAGVDPAAVQAIVDEAFRAGAADGGTVDALLAVSGGQLVLEAYNGWDPAAPHMSWSMAKSVTHALLGLLVAEGRIDPSAPAPVPEWSDPADPRHAITVDQLLRMRSGLDWQEEYAGASDVITMLYGDGRADRGHYAASKPLLAEPDTTFSYSTGTSMILARIIADQVGAGDAGTAWAQAALFDPLGLTSVTHDLDGVGTMSGGSNINMSAQDFARFGLLYLRGGMWDGRQLLPESWVDAARLPRADAPGYGAAGDGRSSERQRAERRWGSGAQPPEMYGAQWWVDDGAGRQRVSFRADGFAGQVIIVVPSLDLVVVALANTQDGRSDAAAQALVEAFDPE